MPGVCNQELSLARRERVCVWVLVGAYQQWNAHVFALKCPLLVGRIHACEVRNQQLTLASGVR